MRLALPVGLQVVVAPVVGECDYQLEACLAGLTDDFVQPGEGIFVVDARRGLQVKPLLHGEAEYAHHVEVLARCTAV